MQLSTLHQSCVIYAREFEGRYPKHAAALMVYNFFGSDLLEDRYAYPAPNSRIATYDMMEYDWSGEETAKLLAAIDTTDLGKQYYRLGDFMWVRLAAPTGDASIVAGWSSPSPRGRRSRWVVFDDGAVIDVNSRDWRTLWKADTAARRKLGLPPVNPIPP